MAIEGRASADIDAPIEEVFAVAADVEGSPRWQPEIKAVEVRETNEDGHQVLVEIETDAKVRTLSRRCASATTTRRRSAGSRPTAT
jgi:uncharacterized membrane protein